MASTIRDMARRPGPVVVALTILVLCGIWGSTWLVIREGLADLPPLTSLAVRFVVAWVGFSLVARPLASLEGGERPGTTLSLVHGLLILAVPYALIYWAEVELPSSLVSVLWAVFPMLTAVGAHFALPSERLVGRQWFGLIGGFLGVALMFVTDIPALGAAAVPAAALVLASPVVSAVGTNWIKRVAAGTSSVRLNQRGMLVGALAVGVPALLLERDAPMAWTPRAVFSVLYLALAGTVLTFGLYFWLLRHAPATRMSLIAYVIPIVALLLGGTVGDEPVGLLTIGGMLLILAGVAVVITPPRARGGRTGAEPDPDQDPEHDPEHDPQHDLGTSAGPASGPTAADRVR